VWIHEKRREEKRREEKRVPDILRQHPYLLLSPRNADKIEIKFGGR
jgi:hypothetical protein